MTTSHVVEVAGKILIVSIVVLSVIVIFVCFVHLYAKWFWYRREGDRDAHNTRRRHRRPDFSAGYQEQQSGVTVLRRGLNPSFLKTIPVIPFDPLDFKQGLECAVCLSELAQGEKTRILPRCNHGFHVECIDMWFHSHSTCPICRGPVSDQTEISVENLLEGRQTQEEESLTDSGDFPTNVLFWGDETEVSTLTSQLEEANSLHQPPVVTCEPASSSLTNGNQARPHLVIDIPTQIDDDDCYEDHKSPVSSRMTSLRRILSSGTRFINPFSPATTNLEQGARGHL